MGLPAAKQRELSLLVRDDVEALRSVLLEEAGSLGAVLGVPSQQLEALAAAGVGEVRRGVTELLETSRRCRTRALMAHGAGAASRAAERLALTARWSHSGVELDPATVLRPLLSDRTRPWVAFQVDGEAVVVRRATLKRAAAALRPFGDVRVLVTADALRLRWRRGVGGLDLRSQAGHAQDESLVLRVVLERPAAQPVQALPRPQASRSTRSWLGEVIAELTG